LLKPVRSCETGQGPALMTAAQRGKGRPLQQDGSARSSSVIPPLATDARYNSEQSFRQQVSYASDVSFVSKTGSTTSDPMDSHHCSRQCSDIDRMVSVVVSEVLVKQAIRAAVKSCKFCVTIANPRGFDFPLIAVSEEFETMTGFKRSEILGVNCRFLNQGCDMNPAELMDLRIASETGAPFTSLLPNRKKTGELFLNLLDLRGLTVAKHSRTGEDLWFLIGIQADVTELAEEEVPTDHLSELQVLADGIRSGIMKELSAMACAGASQTSGDLPDADELKPASAWQLLDEPVWRPGDPLGQRRMCTPRGSDLLTKSFSQGSSGEPASASTARPVWTQPAEKTAVEPSVVPTAVSQAAPATKGAPVAEEAPATGEAPTLAQRHADEGQAREAAKGATDAGLATSCSRSPWTLHKDLLPIALGVLAFSGAILLIRQRRVTR